VRCLRGSNFRLLQCVQVATSDYCSVFRQQLQITAVCSGSNFRLLQCVRAATSGYYSVQSAKCDEVCLAERSATQLSVQTGTARHLHLRPADKFTALSSCCTAHCCNRPINRPYPSGHLMYHNV